MLIVRSINRPLFAEVCYMSLISDSVKPCGSTYRKEDGSGLQQCLMATQDLPIQDLRRRLVQIAKQRDHNEKEFTTNPGLTAGVSANQGTLFFRLNLILRKIFGHS